MPPLTSCIRGGAMAMIKLVIPGRLPGLNEYIAAERTNRYRAAAMKRDAERLVLLHTKKCLRKWRQTGRPVLMRYTWYEKDRRRDMDNISAYGRKVIQDALVKGGYLKGDGWQHVIGFTDSFAVDKKNPRIEVEIVEVTT